MVDEKALPTTPVTPDQPSASARRSSRRTVPPGEWWRNPHATEVRRLGLSRSQNAIDDEIVQLVPMSNELEQQHGDELLPPEVKDGNDSKNAEGLPASVQEDSPRQLEEQRMYVELSAFAGDLTRVTSNRGRSEGTTDLPAVAKEQAQALERSNRRGLVEGAEDHALAQAPAPAPYEITPEARVGGARDELLRAPRKGVSTRRQVSDTGRMNTNQVAESDGASGSGSGNESEAVLLSLPLARGDDLQYRNACAGISVASGLTLNELSIGVLELRRDARSGYRRATHGDELYYVIRGTVELEVGGSSSTLGTGDMFGVPNMQYYKLENVSRNASRLVFLASRRD